MSHTPLPDNGPAAPDQEPDDDDVEDEADQQLSVGDPVTGKTRRLSRQCDTCIFRPAT